MTKHGKLRCLLLLALVMALGLEALLWLRWPAREFLLRAFPRVGLDRSGKLVYFDTWSEEEARVVRILDGRRRVLKVIRRRGAVFGTPGEPDLAFSTSFADERSIPRAPLDNPRFWRHGKPEPARIPTLESLAQELNEIEMERGSDGPFWIWSVRDGKLTCRKAESGEPFVLGLGWPSRKLVGLLSVSGKSKGKKRLMWFFLNPAGAGRLVRLETEWTKGESAAPKVPAQVDVKRFPLRVMHGQVEGERVTVHAALVGRRLLVFLADGRVLADIRLPASERLMRITGADSGGWIVHLPGIPAQPHRTGIQVGIETAVGPVDLTRKRRRLRLVRPGRETVVRDVELAPARTSEYLAANVAPALDLFRPWPLVLASARIEPASDWEGHRARGIWWWRDPWFAGGAFPGWQIGCLLLALGCALLARRSARRRCATLGAARAWTAAVFLLGPFGLLWMRLSLPSLPVERVGQGLRAVHLDRCPETEAAWPEPQPTGTEIFTSPPV